MRLCIVTTIFAIGLTISCGRNQDSPRNETVKSRELTKRLMDQRLEAANDLGFLNEDGSPAVNNDIWQALLVVSLTPGNHKELKLIKNIWDKK